MHISELVFKKRSIFNFLLLIIVVGGVISFDRISKLEDPEIAIVRANIITVYPGASAHDVEMKVTDLLEDNISALANIRIVKSRSEANVSVIQVDLDMNVPQRQVQQRWEFLRRKLELARPHLPEGARDPIVIDDISDVYGMFYGITAGDGFTYQEMSDYARFIKQNLLEIDGVSKVNIYGEQTPTIDLILSVDKMSEMGVYPIQIISAIKDQSKEVYSGQLESGSQEIRVTVNDKIRSAQDIENILIEGFDKRVFKLGDFAEVKEGYKQPLKNTLFINNKKALGVSISMESGENVIKLGEKVEARLDELKRDIPVGLEFNKVFFQPDNVTKSIDGFMINLMLSVAIVVIVLMLTMGLQGGMIIGAGLVLTILATFPILHFVGGTLQRISLGAFIIAMGMLVDNAIVILDGITIELQRGKKSKSAFIKTAKQTAMPLLGATIIAISAFLPVFLSPDTAGEYVKDLFVVLAISLTISWILALTQVPMHAAKYLKVKSMVGKEGDKEKPLYRFFRKFITICMKNRVVTISIAVILLVCAGLGFKDVKKTFFPDFDYRQFYVEYTLPKGATPDKVNEDLKRITEHFISYDEVEMVATSHGMTPTRYCFVRGMQTENADNYGELIVNFSDYETMMKMKPIFNRYLHEEFPEAISRIRKYNLSIRATHTLEAQFSGPDPKVLKDLSSQAKEILKSSEYIDKYTICDDWEPSITTVIAEYDQTAARHNGTTRSDVSNAILAATDGLPLGTIYKGEVPYAINFKIRDKNGDKIEDLNDIPVWNTLPNIGGIDTKSLRSLLTGATSKEEMIKEIVTSIPLSSVTKGVTFKSEEAVVRREDGKRTIQAQADPLDGYSPAEVQASLTEAMSSIEIPEGYTFRWVGESELKDDAMKNIIAFAPLSFGIIILILLLLFNDYKRPLIVMLCLPMSFIGIIPGLLSTGQPFSFVAIVGVLGLTGMLIKNAIVLLDEIDVRLKTSKTRYSAVVEATISRVRPVVMASVTTVLGMIPLLVDPMYGAMAVAIISGLIIGTIITLIFIPILYSILFGVKVENS